MNGVVLRVHPVELGWYSYQVLVPSDTLILSRRSRLQPKARLNAFVTSSDVVELSAPTVDEVLPSVAHVAGTPKALTFTSRCAQMTVTALLSSLSTVMLTPHPAEAD